MNYVQDLLTLSETATYLGMNKETLARIRKDDPSFPVITVGRRYKRVKFEHLQDWIDKKAQEQLKERKARG